MRVFISHSSKDKPAVEKLALALRERDIDPWLDKWEIGPGDDIVASINQGLEQAGAGLVVFSRHSRDSRWVEAETSYLTYARIVESKVLIPIVLAEEYWVPPLLRPLARRGIEEIDAIADALHRRKGGPPPLRAAEHGLVEPVLITLRREGQTGVRVALRIGEQDHGGQSYDTLPPELVDAEASFLRGFRTGLRMNADAAQRTALDASMAGLGRSLGTLCLPGSSAEALVNVLDGCPVGTTVEVCFEADGAELLSLPFEALRLPDGRLLATHPSVVMLRRPLRLEGGEREPLAGPVKILVAVGAPDEQFTSAAVLDHERELQNILDAVEVARRHENVEVRILEVGHPDAIGAAMEADAYHVLHLSCHGLPGALELENEDGRAVHTTADELLDPIRRAGRPLPLVLLNSCHGGVQDGRTASFAEALMRAGVPCVLAMQTSVSDFYATHLARAFYQHLANREHLLASRALAGARKELERARLAAVQQGAALAETQPEYATATLFVAGEERPLANFALDKQPLRTRPVYDVAGPVPQLRIDDLIGRRTELRETLRALRDVTRRHAGVVLTGIGGVGKSAVAGRAMQRLAEDGWFLAACAGRFDLSAIAMTIGVALLQSGQEESKRVAELLTRADLPDEIRFNLVRGVLAEERVVLVLDDFEQNLKPGGEAFLDDEVSEYLQHLARDCRSGRLLITSRYPVPNAEEFLHRVRIGPLSLAESRKLMLRLPSLRDCDSRELARILQVIGGHPRMLEFLDAVQRRGEGRLPHVTEKLNDLLAGLNQDLRAAAVQPEDRIQAAILLGARDVFLEELFEIARREGLDQALLQTAVSNLPVTPAALARMLADDSADPGNPAFATKALERLGDLSLVHRFPDGSAWVHRWTAEGLALLVEPERYRGPLRAGRSLPLVVQPKREPQPRGRGRGGKKLPGRA